MHEVQEAVKNFDSMDDDEIIDAVVNAWSVVCEENEAHKNMVSARDFENWVTYRDQNSQKLKDIVESYEGELSEGNRNALEQLAANIARATHKSRADLVEEARNAKDKQAIETVKSSTANDIEKKKSVWTKILNKFSKR